MVKHSGILAKLDLTFTNVDLTKWGCQTVIHNWTLFLFFFQVFLKYYHVDRLLQIVRNYNRSALKIQKTVRGWLARRRVGALREERNKASIKIQAGVYTYACVCVCVCVCVFTYTSQCSCERVSC